MLRKKHKEMQFKKMKMEGGGSEGDKANDAVRGGQKKKVNKMKMEGEGSEGD